MNNDMPYQTWRNEVSLWCDITDVPSTSQGLVLLGQLSYDDKAVVTGRLDKSSITSTNGVKQIINVLDTIYMKSGSTAYADFVAFRRKSNGSFEDYFDKFSDDYSKYSHWD